MAQFRISFEADPENSTAHWSGQKRSTLKMMQSLTDYLEQRCCAWNVRIMEVIDKPEEVAAKPTRKKAVARK
jgi:hypothetical protein